MNDTKEIKRLDNEVLVLIFLQDIKICLYLILFLISFLILNFGLFYFPENFTLLIIGFISGSLSIAHSLSAVNIKNTLRGDG